MTPTRNHLFPRYHVRMPYGYMNDPNGPVLHRGRYHLFFQYRTDPTGERPVSWGHVSSVDLAVWTYHRPAISPLPWSAETDGVWSGNVIEHNDELVAFYSAFDDTRPYQSIMMARSVDGGESFGNPTRVIDDPGPTDHVEQFRDPFVWREGNAWKLAVGAGLAGNRASVRLYESDDLVSWTQHPPLATLERADIRGFDTGAVWECPQVLTFGSGEVILVSAYSTDSGIGEVLTLPGRSSPDSLEAINLLDHGTNLYAAAVMRSSTWGPLVWGWITEGRDPAWAAADGWSGAISLPRMVELRAGNRLACYPIPALEVLRCAPLPLERRDDARLSVNVPAAFELRIEIAAGHTDPIELELRASTTERLNIRILPQEGSIDIDRSIGSEDLRAHTTGLAFTDPTMGAGGRVSIFIDGSILEIFSPDGYVATTRFYPVTPPPWTMSISGLNTSDIACWPLKDGRP